MVMQEIPDCVRSPRGKSWAVMFAFDPAHLVRTGFPPADGEVPEWQLDYEAFEQHDILLRSRTTNAALAARNTYLALTRVDNRKRYEPRQLLIHVAREDMGGWAPIPMAMKKAYDIDGGRARVVHLNKTVALMEWVDFPGRGTFHLWRWQVALAALGPVDFEMLSTSFEAREDEI